MESSLLERKRSWKPEIRWHELRERGAYVTKDGKALVRVHERVEVLGIPPPMLSITGDTRGPRSYVLTQISRDPFVSLAEARRLCAGSGLRACF